jgi:outer membrane protein assembly factor BamB
MILRVVMVALCGLVIAACSSDAFEWLGEPPPPPLPGDRIAVLEFDTELKVDAGAAQLPVILPPPLDTPNWPQ